MNDDTILRKIQKAMALANDKRGDANTAAIALRQAQKLMEAYGITHQRVMAASCTHTDIRSKFSVANAAQWEVNLMWFICDAFGCRPLWTRGGPEPTNKGYWAIVGPKNYVEVAQYAIEVTMREVLKARNAFVAGVRADPVLNDLPRGEKTKKADEFCIGWGYAVKREIHKMADPDGLVAASTKAYAEEHWNLKKDAKTNDRIGDNFKVTKTMLAGARAGESFRLHRPMNADEDKTLKIGG